GLVEVSGVDDDRTALGGRTDGDREDPLLDEVAQVLSATLRVPSVVDVVDLELPPAHATAPVDLVADGLHGEAHVTQEGGPDPRVDHRGGHLDRPGGHALVRRPAVLPRRALQGRGGSGALA